MLEDIEKNIKKDVKKNGYFVALFEKEEGEPAFAYTIGLYDKYEHPEFVLFGLNLDTMMIMLSDAAERVKAGEKFEVKQDYGDFLEGYNLMFQHANVDEYKGFFGYGVEFYEGHDFPMLQMVWPDQEHLYPWDEKFNDALLARQPLLI